MRKTLRRETYLAILFLTFYNSLPAYISSSFLNQKISDQAIGLVYAIGSIVVILGMLYLSRTLSRLGLLTTSIFLTVLAALAVIPLALGGSLWLLLGAFILYYALGSIIRYHLDIYLENISSNAETGSIRAWSMTAVNLAWLASPLLATWLISTGGFSLVYLAAGLTLIPFILLIAFLMPEHRPQAAESEASIMRRLWALLASHSQASRNLKNILFVDLSLNFFYTVMVIYLPIYLNTKIGLSWLEIGLVFSIMLIPFVLFELPLGRLADKIYGEKEIMIAGLILAGATTIWAGLLTSPDWRAWAVLLFLNRSGAAAIEIMKESYLFKKIDGHDLAIIGISRLNSPLSSLLGPLFGVIVLAVGSFQWLFIFLGCLVLLTMLNAWHLVDTR
jgi:MFS family permease